MVHSITHLFNQENSAKSLHDNTSDIMFQAADLPVNNDMIDIYGVIGQSKLQFQSSYHYINECRRPWLSRVIQVFTLDVDPFLNLSFCMAYEVQEVKKKDMPSVFERLYE